MIRGFQELGGRQTHRHLGDIIHFLLFYKIKEIA
jgi:hypothetical protein